MTEVVVGRGYPVLEKANTYFTRLELVIINSAKPASKTKVGENKQTKQNKSFAAYIQLYSTIQPLTG